MANADFARIGITYLGHYETDVARKRFAVAANMAYCGHIGAVGLGNIWRFPNVLYSNGGGSFMIPYIVSLFILGISFVLVEYAVGFKFKT